jgi:hypothetical protein
MPTFELDTEELSLLQTCVALALSGVFQNRDEAERISTLIKNETTKLEALYSKLEHPRPRLNKNGNRSKNNYKTKS